jgi:hypothetical protein
MHASIALACVAVAGTTASAIPLSAQAESRPNYLSLPVELRQLMSLES